LPYIKASFQVVLIIGDCIGADRLISEETVGLRVEIDLTNNTSVSKDVMVTPIGMIFNDKRENS